MPLPSTLAKHLVLPVIGAPMFIVSTPELVIAQCRAGIIGAFPALNARPQEQLDAWLTSLEQSLASTPQAAPYAVNLIVHPSNERLESDLACCVKHRVPLVITSLGAPAAIVPQVHAYGGSVFHDVTNVRHAEKALEAGVDGLILVAAGAGGHGGTSSPFALVAEVRRFFAGPLALAGAITHGRQILAALAMGVDFAYIGTRFIATQEANASVAYKQAILAASSADIVYTPYFTGVPGNYLKASIIAAGLDPDKLPSGHGAKLEFARATEGAKAWRDIWGAGQGVGTIDDVPTTAALIERLRNEFYAARAALCREGAVSPAPSL